MTILDVMVMAVAIIGLLVIGLWGSHGGETTEDFFLAGRKLKWWQIGFSLFATNFSASAIIGLTGAAYLTGIAIYNYEWIGILTMIFFALILVKLVRDSQVFTIAQYLEERYDARIKNFYSAFIIFLIVFIDMAGSLYAGGLLLSQLLPGISMNVIIFGIMLMAGLYSVIGGLRAISRTDVLQSFIIIIGALLVSYFTFVEVGGWSNFKAQIDDNSLSLFRNLDDRAVPWLGMVIGIPVLCAYFWLVNQNMVQWVLSAESADQASKGLLMAGSLKLVVLFIIIIPGVAALQIFPDLIEADRIYPTLLTELLPAGILGIVLTGFIAALMSNTDSTLHAASTIMTMDLVRKVRPELTSGQLIRVSRIITVIIIFISALWAPLIGNFGTLFEYVQGLLSYAVAPFVVVYLGGIFCSRATSRGAMWALIVGVTLATILGGLKALEMIQIHYLYVPLPVSIICAIVLYALRGKSFTHPEKRLTWTLAQSLTVSRSTILLSLALMSLLLTQLWFFW